MALIQEFELVLATDHIACKACGAPLRRGNPGPYCSPCEKNPQRRLQYLRRSQPPQPLPKLEPEHKPEPVPPPQKPEPSAPARPALTITAVVNAVSVVRGIDPDRILHEKNSGDAVEARNIVAHICHVSNGPTFFSLPKLGMRFGGMHHTSVAHGIEMINKRLAAGDENLRASICQVKALFPQMPRDTLVAFEPAAVLPSAIFDAATEACTAGGGQRLAHKVRVYLYRTLEHCRYETLGTFLGKGHRSIEKTYKTIRRQLESDLGLRAIIEKTIEILDIAP